MGERSASFGSRPRSHQISAVTSPAERSAALQTTAPGACTARSRTTAVTNRAMPR